MILRPLVLVAAVAAAAPTNAQTATDDAAVRATAHFEAGHFPEAAALFARAYRADPRPEYLWGWAQAERKAGNCPVAVQVYRRYLEHDLSPARIEAAEKNVLRCGYTVEEIPEPTPGTALDGLYRDDAPADEDVPKPRPWPKDPVGATLVAGGSAGLVIAAGLWGGRASARERARDAELESDYQAHVRRADRLQIGAIVTTVVGAGLLVGGVVRWMIVRRNNRDRIAWQPLPGGGTLTIRF